MAQFNTYGNNKMTDYLNPSTDIPGLYSEALQLISISLISQEELLESHMKGTPITHSTEYNHAILELTKNSFGFLIMLEKCIFGKKPLIDISKLRDRLQKLKELSEKLTQEELETFVEAKDS